MSLSNKQTDLYRLILLAIQESSEDVNLQERLDLYVSSTAGHDGNSGLSSTSPVKTLKVAVGKIPTTISAPVVIHVASGTYQWDFTLDKTLRESMFIIGDGAGQSGDTGFTTLSSGTAQAGSDISTLVTTGGLTLNELQGLSLRITSGAAAGDIRTIRNNTTTSIVPSREFSAAVAATDTYEVVKPSVRITLPSIPDVGDYEPQVLNMGSTGHMVQEYYSSRNPALYMINLGLDSDVAGNGYSGFSIVNSSIVMVGVECDPIVATTPGYQVQTIHADVNSMVNAGIDYNALYIAMSGPAQIGLVDSDTKWAGWGLATKPYRNIGTNATSFLFYHFRGIISAEWLQPLGGEWWLMGGSVVYSGVTFSLTPALLIRGGTRVRMGEWNPFLGAVPFYVRSEESTTTRELAILVDDHSYLSVNHALIEKDGQGVAIQAGTDNNHDNTGPGIVSICGDTGTVNINGSGGASFGLVARAGGRITFLTAYLTMTGWTAGTQTAVWATRLHDGPPAVAQDLVSYLTHGASITNGSGAYVERG